MKNPWPNVDAHSGVLLQHYGITEAEYYTVMFGAPFTRIMTFFSSAEHAFASAGALTQRRGICAGVSRSIGCLAQLIISRAMGYPIERPKTVTSEYLVKQFGPVA